MPEDKILERVRNLLARAEHPNTPAPEAELCFAQADKLMFKHAIDEALLRSHQTEKERKTPEKRTVSLASESIGEFWPELRTVLGEIAYANRCRAIASHYAGGEITLVGFAEDVAWTEMLFTSIYFAFVRQINPKWNPDASYEENVYNFKVAGYKWAEIDKVGRQNGAPDMRVTEEYEEYSWTSGGYVTRTRFTGRISGKVIGAYKRHAKAIGDTNIVSTQSFSSYRRQFTTAFCNEINRRLRRLADEQAKDADSTPGAALALTDYRRVVDEHFYDMFPNFRPRTEEEIAAEEEARRLQKEMEERRREEMLNRMTPQQRYEFLEKEQRKERREAEKDRRYWEKNRVKHDSSAHARGRSVAASVDLNKPGAPVAHTSERKQLR